jgi:hypothetical protein
MLERQVRHSFNSAIASRVTSPQDLRQLFLQPQRAAWQSGAKRSKRILRCFAEAGNTGARFAAAIEV